MKKSLSLLLLVAAVLFTACSSPRPEGAPEVVKNYLIAPYATGDATEAKLKAAGFDIVARLKPVKKKKGIETFIISNAYINGLANRPMRGLLANAIRVTIDKELHTTQITNPLLYVKAYLQDEYKVGDEVPIVKALMKAFPNAKETNIVLGNDLNVEQLDYTALADYHFMVSMPYYHDMDEVGVEKDMATLIKKLKKGAKKIKSSAKKDKRLVYLIKLAEDRYVAGVRLSKRTEKFVKKIGYKNVGLLPWGILLEMKDVDGKQMAVASALNAKYRIALNYSNLDMGGFMGIMTVPGAIESELSKIFK